MGNIYIPLVDILEDAGLAVIAEPGWEYRSRGSGGFDQLPYAVFWHHTASDTSPQNDVDYMTYSSDVAPVANIYVGDEGGVVRVMAGGATNTNGQGNGVPFSRGSVPIDGANSRVIGMELGNSGVGELYTEDQLNAAFVASNAINAYCGNLPTDVTTHQAYAPDRKIDPATEDAAAAGGWQPGDTGNGAGTWTAQSLKDECARRAGGTPPPQPGGSEMKIGAQSRVDSRSAQFQDTLAANEDRAVLLTLPSDCQFAQLNFTVLPTEVGPAGFASIGVTPPIEGVPNVTVNWAKGDDRASNSMWVATPDQSTVWIRANRECEFIIDFSGVYSPLVG